MKRKSSSVGKKVTTDDLAVMIVSGFDRVDKRIDTVEAHLSQKINGLSGRIDHLVDQKVSLEEHRRLVDRVTRLETARNEK